MTQTKGPVHAVTLLITLALLTQADTTKMALLTQEATTAHLSLAANTVQGPAYSMVTAQATDIAAAAPP